MDGARKIRSVHVCGSIGALVVGHSICIEVNEAFFPKYFADVWSIGLYFPISRSEVFAKITLLSKLDRIETSALTL
jgi:hypothetical protein